MSKTTGLGLLSKFGINLNSEITGEVVTAAKSIENRANVFGLTTASGKKFLAGKKSFDEGLLETDKNDKGEEIVVVAKGFETYTNNQGEVWVRNKERAQTAIGNNW
jgi:hypothetical protein